MFKAFPGKAGGSPFFGKGYVRKRDTKQTNDNFLGGSLSVINVLVVSLASSKKGGWWGGGAKSPPKG